MAFRAHLAQKGDAVMDTAETVTNGSVSRGELEEELSVLATALAAREGTVGVFGQEGSSLVACLREVLYFMEDMALYREPREMNGVFQTHVLPLIREHTKSRSRTWRALLLFGDMLCQHGLEGPHWERMNELEFVSRANELSRQMNEKA